LSERAVVTAEAVDGPCSNAAVEACCVDCFLRFLGGGGNSRTTNFIGVRLRA
jgi:hypothetical protein